IGRIAGTPIIESWRSSTSNHLLRFVVRFAIAAQDGRARAGIDLVQPRSDLRVLALEQAVALEIALYQKRPEILDLKHPDRLGETQLLKPMHTGNPLDSSTEQCPSAVADRR